MGIMSELKIGDTLCKYVTFAGLNFYTVTAIITREQATLYELESKNCKHGYNCRLLVAKINDKPGKYRFVSMLNDDEENRWHSWHDDSLFYISKMDARRDIYLQLIQERKAEIDKYEATLGRLKKGLVELNEHFENTCED